MVFIPADWGEHSDPNGLSERSASVHSASSTKEALPSGKPQEKTQQPRRKRFGLKNHHRAPARFLFQRGALHSVVQCSRTKRFALLRRGHSGGATCPPGLAGHSGPRSASIDGRPVPRGKRFGNRRIPRPKRTFTERSASAFRQSGGSGGEIYLLWLLGRAAAASKRFNLGRLKLSQRLIPAKRFHLE